MEQTEVMIQAPEGHMPAILAGPGTGGRKPAVLLYMEAFGVTSRVVYPGADHGFFCNERSSYNQAAAEDSWRELVAFFAARLKN